MLLDRKSFEALEALLFATKAQCLAAECKLRALTLECEAREEHHSIVLRSLKVGSEVLRGECCVLSARLQESLADKERCVRIIARLEQELQQSRTVPSRGGNHTISFHNDTDDLNQSSTVEALALSNPSGSSREEELHSLIDKSNHVFAQLEHELQETKYELHVLRCEKQLWQSNEYELHDAIQRLQSERELYVSCEVERSAGVIVALQSLMAEEKKERHLWELRAESTMHMLAYQRGRNDVTILAKNFGQKLEAVCNEVQRERRQREVELRMATEQGRAEVLARQEHLNSKHEKLVEDLRLQKQKLELQNQMLKANCDEWRLLGEKKDHDHQKIFEAFRREAIAQLETRDLVLEEKERSVLKLKGEANKLDDELQRCRQLLQQTRSIIASLELEEKKRQDELKSKRPTDESTQTLPTETPDLIEQRLRRELRIEFEEEGTITLARKVTSHPLFLALQETISSLQERVERAEAETERAQVTIEEQRQLMESMAESSGAVERLRTQELEALRFDRDGLVQRLEVAERHRASYAEESQQFVSSMELLHGEKERIAAMLHEANGTREELERRWRQSMDAQSEMATECQRLARLAESERAKREAIATDCAVAVSAFGMYQEKCRRLELQLLVVTESHQRVELEHNLQGLLDRLSSIQAAFFASTQ